MKLNKFIILFIIVFTVSNAFSLEFDFIPYQGSMKKIKTEHFHILFPKKYTETAKKVATYAEDIHKNISPLLNWAPIRRTTIIITDHTDFPNGMAIPVVRNTIVLYISPSDLEPTLRDHQNPLYSLILHEYTHILHLDQIRGAAWFWRVLFGKLYHPHINTFRWYLEGVAVLFESKEAGGGRLDSSYNDAIVRRAVLDDKIPSFNKLIYPVVDFPNGNAVYHYGAKFVEYIYTEYGEEKFNAFIKDLSDDFWPFILLFVMKFKKVYGKSLRDLWKEWTEYEIKMNKDIVKNNTSDIKKITNLEGKILSIDKHGDSLLISSYSYKNDMILYRLHRDGKLEKLHYGYHRSVTSTYDDNFILYTCPVTYPGGLNYFELYSFNINTKIERRLTWKGRVNYVSFAKDAPKGVFVSHNGNGSKMFSADFNKGDLENINEIKIPDDIVFIDSPSINNKGDKVVFSARRKDNTFRLYILDLNKIDFKIIDEKIPGMNAKWIDDSNICFTAPDGITDSLYGINLTNLNTYRLVSSYGCILNGLVDNEWVYAVDYTTKGEEIFLLKKTETDAVIDTSLYEAENDEKKLPDVIDNWDIKPYVIDSSLLPTVWAFLPYQLGSKAHFYIPNYGYLSIPYVGPQYLLYNTLPLGRFSYRLTVGLDYMKLYPDNSLYLNFKLPFVNLSYYWENWAGGYRDFVYIDRNNYGIAELRYNGMFPINFINSISLYRSYSLLDAGYINWEVSATHRFKQYDFTRQQMTNEISFYESIGYSISKSRLKATRWDRGFYIGLNAYQYPHYILDNIPLYIFRGELGGRAPFLNAFFFVDIEGGMELFFRNVFSAYSELFRLNESLVFGSSSGSLYKIDIKAFPTGLADISSGSAFISADIGFDITFIKKTVYWYFATMGFKEFYMKTYGEFVFLYNELNLDEQYRGILFDLVVELGLDLFIAYGNITTGFVFGQAYGYRVGDDFPAISLFLYFNINL